MATTTSDATTLLNKLEAERTIAEVLADLKARPDTESFGESLQDYTWSKQGQQTRLGVVRSQTGAKLQALVESKPVADPEVLRGNIENFIGMTQVPTGVIGPVAINGTAARGGFYVPLATTEGALVASYNRGAKATRLAGGITSVCLTEAVQRAPLFKFRDLTEAGNFLQWVLKQRAVFDEIVAATSRYAKILDMRINLEGNHVTLIFEYSTGDAAGQNMVTICSEKICAFIMENTPVDPTHHFIESNYSGDKKATAVSFSRVRGKKVTAEVRLSRAIVVDVLQSTPELMMQYWRTATVGTAQSGALGLQGHVANGLTALYLACGQDVACVAESYVGITRFEQTEEGGLYASVTLPALTVGTVGGGTSLPTQRDCLEMLGCSGAGTARKFAEICGATVLCGELSISAAIASGHFARAHAALGRKKTAS